MTKDTVQKLEEAFRSGLSVQQACYTSGISTSTYYEHIAVNADFSDKMKLAQEYVIIKAKQLIVQEIEDGNVSAAKWWLERKAKSEFSIKADKPDTKEPDLFQKYDAEYIYKVVGDAYEALAKE